MYTRIPLIKWILFFGNARADRMLKMYSVIIAGCICGLLAVYALSPRDPADFDPARDPIPQKYIDAAKAATADLDSLHRRGIYLPASGPKY